MSINVLYMCMITLLCVTGVIALAVMFLRRSNNISFQETLDVIGLPIITFKIKGQKFNFLLDTGSSHNIITPKLAEFVDGDTITSHCELVGAGACSEDKVFMDVPLQYNNHIFEIVAIVSKEMEAHFKEVKRSKGATIHGIVGSMFFEEYKYVLDYNNKKAFYKKYTCRK